MLIPALLATATAVPPDTKVQLKDLGVNAGQVQRMEVSVAGDMLTGRTQRNLGGWLYDLDSWRLRTFKPCDVTGIAPVSVTIDGRNSTDLWVACGDGTVRVENWDGYSLEPVIAGGSEVSVQVDDSLSDIWYDAGSGWLYAVSVAGKGNSRIHVIDPFDVDFNAVDSGVDGNFPKTLAFPGYVEGLVIGGTLVVSHSGRGMSILTLGPGGSVATFPATPLQFDCDDIAPNQAGNVYCVDRTLDRVFEYVLTTRSGFGVPLGKLSGPEAVSASLDPLDPWLAVTGDQVTVWEIEPSGAIVDPPAFQGPPDADNPINDMVSHDGYLFGGGPEGGLHVVTARPWVYPGSVVVRLDGTPLADDEVVETGSVLTVEFQVDTLADYGVFIGGNRAGLGGELITVGTAQPDTKVRIEFEVDADSFVEGFNSLYIVADNAAGGTGHARADILVDNAPGRPSLGQRGITFADRALDITFDGIPDEDLDHYDVYVTTAPWDPKDWVTQVGGPGFDGNTALSTPIEVAAAAGETQSIRISPLENDVTYYIGVRATDRGGKEGPMSAVVSGTPRETFTASELAGEMGGSPCSTTGGPASWLALIGVGALGLLRRRRTGWAAAAVGLAGLSAAPQAQAQDDAETPSSPFWERRDLTPARGNVEIRYGVINFADPALNDVFKGGTNHLMVEFGPQFFRIAEIDLGVGYFRKKGFTVSGNGTPSSDETRLTMWPLSIDGTLRAHILDEQPVVPFVRYGFDYAIWSESTDNDSGGTDVIQGGKVGTHIGFGGQILLDIFQPRRASLLEAQSGINDTWLTIEWRSQRLDGRSAPWATNSSGGLVFDGNSFTVGLKLDY